VHSALGISVSPDEQQETLETLDPGDDGYVAYGPFLEFAALQLNALAEDEDEERQQEELQAAYNMFTHNGPGPITIAHLRRVAKTIREDVDDGTLKEMIMEANGKGKNGWRDGVDVEEFEKVLKRAGVLG
jgi:Ca2+-binding EF-hand superfamily protein